MVVAFSVGRFVSRDFFLHVSRFISSVLVCLFHPTLFDIDIDFNAQAHERQFVRRSFLLLFFSQQHISQHFSEQAREHERCRKA